MEIYLYTGQITNLEIWLVTTYPEETIYIDFGYKGMPKVSYQNDVRDPPDLDIVTTEGDVEEQPPIAVPEVKQQIQQFIIRPMN